MDIKSLTLKNILLDDDKEEYFDLSVPSFNIDNTGVSDVHFVTHDEEGRIDKICQKYYGTTEYIDILCFINHIFNPFSVQEGDLLVIPYVTSIANQLYSKPAIPGWLPGETSTNKQNKQNKSNEKDENRVNRLKQQKTPRKPNELKEGQSVKKYVNGKIILGTHLNTNNG